MDRGQIFASVVSSIVTAVVFFLVGQSIGLFGDRIEDNQIGDLADAIVGDPGNKSSLIAAMREDGGFVGPAGKQGPKGDDGQIGPQGVQGEKGDTGSKGAVGETGAMGQTGPIWQPTVRLHRIESPRSSPKSQERDLGSNLFCALAQAGEAHQNQACICNVFRSGRSWLFRLRTDQTVDGACYCSAVCVN